MCSVYIRHELLRHQVIRSLTFLSSVGISDERKRVFIFNGYFYDKHHNKCICFSCHHDLDVTVLDIEKQHKDNSPHCQFIRGNDISIDFKRESNTPLCKKLNPETVWCRPVHPDVMKFFKKILDIESNSSCSEFSDINYPSIQRPYIRLRSIHDPVHIPGHTHSQQTFAITKFFLAMRSSANRYATYKVENHKFPASDDLIRYFVSNGFFYTLYGTALQCFACRLVLGNLDSKMEPIDKLHREYTPWCPLFTQDDGIDCKDLPPRIQPRPPFFTTEPTDCEDVQCKVCLINRVNVLLSCGHPLCNACGWRIDTCAFCRAPIKSKTQIFWQ